MSVAITLLGRFEVALDGERVPDDAWERRQATALVKLLALAPGHRLHREQCIDAIWPDLTLDDAAPRLHKAAHYARKATGSRDAIVLRREQVSLFPDTDVTVDAVTFEEAASRALQGDGDALERAITFYGGPLLPGDPYEEWLERRREHLRQLYVQLLREGQRWTELVAEDPTDEDAHIALMRAFVARGDRHAALRQFERMDRALGRELGVAPASTAIQLRDEIVSGLHDSSAVPDTPADTLVGRSHELQTLHDVLQRAAEGRGCAVFVSGPPGIGKSTLLHALREHAARSGWRIGMGVAASIEGAWPYAPVLEAFSDLSRRHPTLLDGLDDTYRAEIDRALTGADATGLDRPVGHQRLFIAALELLRLAAAGPGLLLVVDDIHDADDATLRLLHYLARSAVDERVVIALGHRPGATQPLDELRTSLKRRDAAAAIELTPLDYDGVRRLVVHHRPNASAEVVDRAWAVSGGVPFVAVEAARRDESVDSAVIGLDPATREVLQRVAVAGMTFDTDEFVVLAGLSDDEAFPHLEAALAANVVERRESGYAFRHALLRDALLADLAPHRQRLVHQAAARGLEELGASPARVGHHLLRAGDPGAVGYLLRAAETETALGAYRDAFDLVESIRDHARGEQLAQVCALRGDLLFALGDPRAVAAYREALELATGTDRRLVRAKLGRAAVFMGDMATAAGALTGLEPDGGAADGTIMLAKANHAFFSGDVETASTLADLARGRIEQDPRNWQLLDLISLQALIAHNQGEWFEQLRLELRRTLDAPSLATAVFDGHLCVAEYLLYGPIPYSEVLDIARSLRATAQRAGALRAVAFAAALEGEAALLAGDLDRAERELMESVDLHSEIGATAGEAHSLQRLAEVRLERGDRAEARTLLQRALPLARWSPIALHLLQRIYGTTIRAADTVADARAAVDIATAALGTDDFCAFCQVMFEVPAAIACADAGDLDAARLHLAIAERSAALWHGTAWQAAMLEARAHLAAAEHSSDARDILDQARLAFEQAGQPLDAARCLASLDSVSA